MSFFLAFWHFTFVFVSRPVDNQSPFPCYPCHPMYSVYTPFLFVANSCHIFLFIQSEMSSVVRQSVCVLFVICSCLVFVFVLSGQKVGTDSQAFFYLLQAPTLSAFCPFRLLSLVSCLSHLFSLVKRRGRTLQPFFYLPQASPTPAFRTYWTLSPDFAKT